jgi:heparin/heparan-sulfate lyase
MTSFLLAAGLLLAPSGLEWTAYDGVSIPVPPAEHPRLYLRARDLPDLERRTTHPVLKPVWEKLQAAGRNDPARAAEAEAIRYLLTRDAELGRRTAAAALKLLQESTFDMKRQDITRPIGRLMVTGAVVYDWCYPVLTAEQKKAYLERLLELAKKLESGYPPPKGGAVTGHYSEWMLMRDLLSAGVAVYDEFPEMYRIAAQRFFSLFVPVRNWWYRGGAFHQGSAYAETRASSELYPLWIFERLGAGPVYDPALRYLPYEWIYMRRPDGQLLRSGDGQSKAPKLRSLLNASYYKDPYVLADYLRDPGIDTASLLFDFLWHDPDLQPRPVAELPLARYMGSPYGWMVARTGWDDASVIAEMKVNLYNFNNHQHLDAGAFQVYYRGALAIDSGVYEGATGGYGSPHDVNYNKRTIAHNSLLIHDPAETFERGRLSMRNDGGQRFPNGWREPKSLEDMLANYRTAEVLGQGFGPDARLPAYTYLKGDLTKAYSGKVRKVERSFVFLNFPGQSVRAALAVFDRVVASDPRFTKYWLLHSMEEPRIEGAQIVVAPQERGWRGKLVDQVLLPAHAQIVPVGGPGKEFWVFGENYPNRPSRGDAVDYELGAWRVEVSPREPATEDLFLNVMQVMDRERAPLAVRRIEESALAGFSLAGTTVVFQLGGRRADTTVAFRSEGNRFLVTDLAPGNWRVTRDGAAAGPPVEVSPEAGVLWFEGPPGGYALEPANRRN